MHKTEIKNPIHLVDTDEMEVITTFKNFDALVRNWDWLGDLYHSHELGPSIKKNWNRDEWRLECYRCHRRGQEWPSTRYKYVLRDSLGDYVDPETVRTRYRELTYRRPHWAYWIPGSKRSRGHYFRRIRTTQERKWSFSWRDEEDEPKPRASRNFANLPNSWDDIPFSNGWSSKNWKTYRRTQYFRTKRTK